MRHVLEQIDRKEKVSNYSYFGGANIEAYRASSLMLGKASALPDEPVGSSEIVDGVSRRMVNSFFKLNGKDQEPLYTTTYDVMKNGVITWLTFQDGFVSAKGALTHVEKLPMPNCAS